MRIISATFAFLLVSLLVNAQGLKGPGNLESTRTVYQKATEKATTTYIAGLADLQSEYQKQLINLDETLRKKGDLESILAVRKEKNRFAQTKTMPEDAVVQSPAELKALQQKYSKSALSLEDSKNKSLAVLAGPYLQTLEDLKKSLTQNGKIDDALAVKDEITKIKAEMEAKSPTSSTTAQADPQSISASPRGTVNCGKCGGTGLIPKQCLKCKGSGKCSICNGTGKKPEGDSLLQGPSKKVKRLGEGSFPCTFCKGSGKCQECNGTGISQDSDQCYVCNGTGRIKSHEPEVAKSKQSTPETDHKDKTDLTGPKTTAVVPVVPAKPKVELQFTDYKKTIEGLRTALSDGKAKDMDFNKAVASQEENKGTLFKSKVYIFEASPRQINVGSSKDDRFNGGVAIKPDSHDVGQKTVSLFWELKRDDLVTVTYGIVSKDSIIYFDVTK